MYAEKNYRTKKELVEEFKAGKEIYCYQPGGIFPGKENGAVCIEGPHYPEPHKWYCSVIIEDRKIVKIKG